MAQRIQIEASTQQGVDRTWNTCTLPEHIVRWHFTDESRHCPSAAAGRGIRPSVVEKANLERGECLGHRSETSRNKFGA